MMRPKYILRGCPMPPNLRKVWAGHLEANSSAWVHYGRFGFQREALLRRHEFINRREHGVVRVGMLVVE